MKVALVHDYLNQYGGGERVLETLMEMFPEAPVYTLLHDEKKTSGKFRGRVKKTSFLDWEFVKDYHRWFIPLMPIAAQTMTMNHNHDIVISDTAGFAKGIKIHTGHCHNYCHRQIHISYIHTPLRYAWETDTYFSNLIFKKVFKPAFEYLKNWDYQAAQKPDILIANSQFIAKKIKKYYGRDAFVIYPPVDTTNFFYRPIRANGSINNYYLAVGRLLHYKRFDLVIDAFAKLGLPLKIVGDGPEREKLESGIQKIENGNIEILPFINDENELRKLYSRAKALIFPQVEDFGLAAAEAQACGCPVIAYAAGGALEIVEPKKTGLFFARQTPENLAAAVEKFETIKWNRKIVAASAQRFSKEKFKKELLKVIKSALKA